MDEFLRELMSQFAWPLLGAVVVLSLAALGKGADWLVDEAVALSERSGIPKVIIGATVVSLGTTTPEAVVSVLAAIQGVPDLALGNAVGSIICDTGLILGLACLISPLPLDRRIVNRQGWIQFASGFLLVAACVPWSQVSAMFVEGGRLSQGMGFLFLLLLVSYLILSVRWSRQQGDESELGRVEKAVSSEQASLPLVVLKLIGAIALVVGASHVLIPAVSEAALRIGVPEGIIAATLVAFGTSLPELVTAVTAARHGHGELAVGNVIGADILNVLFVAGASAAVTSGGLLAPEYFFSFYFPAMLTVLIVFRVGVTLSGDYLKRPFGVVLLGTYLLVTVLSYVNT
jgi:cation:H+ antiporter